MSNPIQIPNSTPNNIVDNNHPTDQQSVADPSSTEDIFMQDPDTNYHETLTDKFVDLMVISRAREAALRIEIGEIVARIVPLESDPELPLLEDMQKLALARCRLEYLKAQRKLRHLLQRDIRATTAMSNLLEERLAGVQREVAGVKMALREMRRIRKPIARRATRPSGSGHGMSGGWGNMMPVTSHAAYAARQQTEPAEEAEPAEPAEPAEDAGQEGTTLVFRPKP
jgi:hypothetical protein